MPKPLAPRTLETRIKLGIKRLRDVLDRNAKGLAYFYEADSGSLMATAKESRIRGKLIGAYTTVDWQQIVEDIEAA